MQDGLGSTRMADVAQADISRLEVKLLHLAARQRRAGRLWVLMRFAAVLGAGFFVYFLADWLTDFPAPLRVAVTLAIPFAIWRWGARRWERLVFSDVSVLGAARLLERLQVEFNSYLISTVQFAKNVKAPGGSALLRQRTIETTVESFDSRAAVPVQPPESWRRAMLLLCTPVVCFAGLTAISPQTAGVFFLRAVGLDRAYPTRTRIVLPIKYPTRIANDQDALIEIQTEGVDPESGLLRLAFEGQEPSELSLKREGLHQYSFTASRPPLSFRFDVVIGDAPLRGGHVTVCAPPGIKSLRVHVEPPAYTEQPAYDVEQGSLAAPEGSRLTVDVEPNRPLKECRLRLPEEKVTLKAENGRYRHTFKPKTSFMYCFEMTDTEGLANSNPAEYQAEIRVDRPPDVVVTKPEMERVVTTVSLFPLQFKADDDLGLKEVVVEYWTEPIPKAENQEELAAGQGRNSDAQPRKRAVLVPGLKGKHLEFNETVPVSRFEAPVGTLVHYRVGVRDTCPEREQIAYGEERTLRVVTARELSVLLSERHAALLKTINKIVDDESSAHKRLKQVLEGEK
jgi:hypothetical protein